MVALSKTRVSTKLGIKPVVNNVFYEELGYFIPVRQRKGWKRAPLFDFISLTDEFSSGNLVEFVFIL